MILASIVLTAVLAPQAAQAPACQAAADPEYGRTAVKAVRIGGGALYMAARERRYLDSLKGPAGQPLTSRRVGTTMAETNGAPIDMWEVTWTGAEKPITLYLLAYKYGEPRVPAGFTCTAFTLGPPPIDGFMSRDQQTALAVEQGATNDFAAISLDTDGSAKRGVVFDRFRRIARAARVAAAAGAPLDPNKLPPPVAQSGVIVAVYPKQCGGKTAPAQAIEVVSTSTAPLQPFQSAASGDALKALLPGVELPVGTLGQRFAVEALRPNDHVRVRYDPAVCEGAAGGEMFEVKGIGSKGLLMPEPTRPEGTAVPDEGVWLQAVVDLDGRLVNAQHVGGPGGVMVDAARKALEDWRAEPARINGSPVVSDTLVVFRFRDK